MIPQYASWHVWQMETQSISLLSGFNYFVWSEDELCIEMKSNRIIEMNEMSRTIIFFLYFFGFRFWPLINSKNI